MLSVVTLSINPLAPRPPSTVLLVTVLVITGSRFAPPDPEEGSDISTTGAPD